MVGWSGRFGSTKCGGRKVSDGVVDSLAGRVPTALALTDSSNAIDGLACIGSDRHML